MIAVPTESPTRIASTPDSSTSRPKSASYAVITTSFSPLRFFSANSRTVTGFVSDFFLSNARAPQCCQLPQPETAVRELGMGNGQARFTHALPLEHHDVEIQCPGAPARCPHSACLLFDALERGEEILRRQLGFDGDHLIEKGSLRDGPDGGGLFGFCLTYDSGFGERGDRASRLRQKYLTLAEIGAKRDVGDVSHARSRSRATSAYASGPGNATFGLRTAIR